MNNPWYYFWKFRFWWKVLSERKPDLLENSKHMSSILSICGCFTGLQQMLTIIAQEGDHPPLLAGSKQHVFQKFYSPSFQNMFKWWESWLYFSHWFEIVLCFAVGLGLCLFFFLNPVHPGNPYFLSSPKKDDHITAFHFINHTITFFSLIHDAFTSTFLLVCSETKLLKWFSEICDIAFCVVQGDEIDKGSQASSIAIKKEVIRHLLNISSPLKNKNPALWQKR